MSTGRVDAVNRVLLSLLGLVLVGAGGLGIAAGLGVFGRADPAVFPPAVRSFAARTGWFWWAVAGACLLLALGALWWLLGQLRTERAARLDLTTSPAEGTTVLHAGALSEAVSEQAQRLRGVSGASAQLREHAGPRLALTVDLAEHAQIGEVRDQLETTLVPQARTAIDHPDLPVQITLRPARTRGTDRGLR